MGSRAGVIKSDFHDRKTNQNQGVHVLLFFYAKHKDQKDFTSSQKKIKMAISNIISSKHH